MQTTSYLKSSGIFSSILAAAFVFVMWCSAGYDAAMAEESCGGCNEILYDFLHSDVLTNKDIKNFYISHNSPFEPLVSGSIILGIFWVITAATALCAIEVYVISTSITYIVFLCFFGAIAARFTPLDLPCKIYMKLAGKNETSFWTDNFCLTTNNFQQKHQYDSYESFLAGAVLSFLLGAYQIIVAISGLYCKRYGIVTRILKEKRSSEIMDKKRSAGKGRPSYGNRESQYSHMRSPEFPGKDRPHGPEDQRQSAPFGDPHNRDESSFYAGKESKYSPGDRGERERSHYEENPDEGRHRGHERNPSNYLDNAAVPVDERAGRPNKDNNENIPENDEKINDVKMIKIKLEENQIPDSIPIIQDAGPSLLKKS